MTAGDLKSEGWQTFYIVMSVTMIMMSFSRLLMQLPNRLYFVTVVSDVDGFEYHLMSLNYFTHQNSTSIISTVTWKKI